MSNIFKIALFSTLILFSCSGARAFTLPNNNLSVGSPVFIENFDEDKHYAVFLPFEEPTKGDVCANMSGKELVEDNNLKDYGTCFINDPGVFTIVELEQPFSSSYESLVEKEEIIQEEKVTMISMDTGENDEGIVNNLDKFIEAAEDEIDRILGNLTTEESTESTTSEESILGIRTINILGLIKENILLITLLTLITITLLLLIIITKEKWNEPKKK